MGFLVGRCCYSKHGASTSRVRASAKGHRTAAMICLVGDGRAGDVELIIKRSQVDVLSPGARG